MDIFNAIIQGVIQGATEFLPISSSGHLSLYQHLTGVSGEAGVLFSVLLHFGTLAAVIIAFRHTVAALIKEFFLSIADIFRGKFSFKNMNPERRMIVMLIVGLLPMIAVFPFKDRIESIGSDGDIIVEGVCFLVTSLLLFLSDRAIKGNKTAADMKYKDAVAVGIAQGFATLPGLSRSGSTISVGMLSGLSREYAVSYSFLLGLFPVLGANVIKLPEVIHSGAEEGVLPIIVGVAVAAAVGLAAIKLVQWLAKSDKFKIFAIYTLVIGLITLGIGIYEKISGVPVTF